MKYLITIILFIISFIAIAEQSKCVIEQEHEFCQVTMIDLLSKPEKYDKKIVTVSGYYFSAWETSAIYLIKDYAYTNDLSYAFWLNPRAFNKSPPMSENQKLEPSYRYWKENLVKITEANEHYIRVTGIFNSGRSGHLGAYQGSITAYLGYEIIEDSYYLEKEKKDQKLRREKFKKELDERKKQ